MEGCTENKKRFRDDAITDSPESKLTRVDSSGSRMVNPCMTENWQNVNYSEPEEIDYDAERTVIDFSEAEEIQDDLLDILADVDPVPERDEAFQSQGIQLDSFIRSFEEEIHGLPQVEPSSKMSSDQNESQPELGYLFEASDDELGLPPTADSNSNSNTNTNAEEKIEAVDFTSPPGIFELLGGNLGFEDEIPCFDSLETGFGIGSGGGLSAITSEENGVGGEFVSLGGLFDYSDVPFRFESLSAL